MKLTSVLVNDGKLVTNTSHEADWKKYVLIDPHSEYQHWSNGQIVSTLPQNTEQSSIEEDQRVAQVIEWVEDLDLKVLDWIVPKSGAIAFGVCDA